MAVESREIGKRARCALCRVIVVLVMTLPVMVYYGFPLFVYFAFDERGDSQELLERVPLDGRKMYELPPCTPYFVDTGQHDLVIAYTPCTEEDRVSLEGKVIDKSELKLRAPQSQQPGFGVNTRGEVAIGKPDGKEGQEPPQ